MKASAADNVSGSKVDIELTLDFVTSSDADSVNAQQTVSSTQNSDDCVFNEHHAETTEEPQISLNTSSNAHSDLSHDHEGSSTAEDNCCDAASVESSTDNSPGDRLAENDLVGEIGASDQSSTVDGDETKATELSALTTDSIPHRNQPSSCNELSSSLTGSLDICGQDVIDSALGCELVSIADLEVGNATVSLIPTSRCELAPCQCSNNSSSAVLEDDGALGSLTEPELEDDESGQCSCDIGESDQALSESETGELSSTSTRSLNGHEYSSSACEQEPSLSAVSESSMQTSSSLASVLPILSLSAHNLHPLVSSVSSKCEIPSGVEMDTDSEAGDNSSPAADVSNISSVLELDCEPGGKASKLDQPLAIDCFAGDNLETSDTGALHMSVGFQSTSESDKVCTSDDDSDLSRDSSIGVLMVCDDDGLVSSFSPKPSAVMVESSHNYTDGVYETSSDSFVTQPSGETSIDKRPLDVGTDVSGQVDENPAGSLDALTAGDVTLYEVESKSREVDELLADVSQNVFNASREFLPSDTSQYRSISMCSNDDSKLCCHARTCTFTI